MAIDIIARGLATSLIGADGKVATDKMPTIEVGSTDGFTSIGKLTDASQVNGKTAEEILLMMLFGIANPVFTEPTVSIQLSENQPTLVIGRASVVSGALVFDRGTIEPAYGTSGYRAGLPISYSIAGIESENSSTTYPFSFEITPTEKENEIIYGVKYSQGEQPLNSVGAPYADPYPAGELFRSIQLNAAYPLYDAQGNEKTFTWFKDLDGEGYFTVFASESSGIKQSFVLPKEVNVVGIKSFDTMTNTWAWLGGETAEYSLTYFDKIVGENEITYIHNYPLTGERELRIYVE